MDQSISKTGLINSVFLHHMYIWVHVQCLPGKHMTPESAMGRRQAGLGNVMLSAMFPWDPWVLLSIHFVMYQFTKQYCRPYTPFNRSWIDCDCGLFYMNSVSKAKVIQECWGNTDLNPAKYLWICWTSAINGGGPTLQFTSIIVSAANMHITPSGV